MAFCQTVARKLLIVSFCVRFLNINFISGSTEIEKMCEQGKLHEYTAYAVQKCYWMPTLARGYI